MICGYVGLWTAINQLNILQNKQTNKQGNTVIGRGLSAPSLSPLLKLHCIALQWQLFSLKMTISFKSDHFDWKLSKLTFQSIWSGLKKWSFWVKIAVIAMHCNVTSMKVTSLVPIDSQYAVNPPMCVRAQSCLKSN